ncbi:MAG: hypothetical protein LC754_02890 [Acidobacteria bacterium]|nr:hypothetical protein [Acidobacteriota bacterium]
MERQDGAEREGPRAESQRAERRGALYFSEDLWQCAFVLDANRTDGTLRATEESSKKDKEDVD